MKFTIPTIALALFSTAYPLLASAQACNDCDEKSLAEIGECTHAWVDKIVYYCQNECKLEIPAGLLEKCEGGLEDENPIGSDNNSTTTTTTPTGTETNRDDVPYPMPTIINDIDPSTTQPGTSTPTETVQNGTTSTTSDPRPTESDAAAAPAFSGIGFGGGAAAMVGLAGLVGLVL